MTFYCSVECQKKHGKQRGHKQHCLAPKEPNFSKNLVEQNNMSTDCDGNGAAVMLPKESDAGDLGKQECSICFDDISRSALCTLPCSHDFHKSCVPSLRKASVVQLCPLCHAELPQDAEKMFSDCASIYFPIHNRMAQAGGSWATLNKQDTELLKKQCSFGQRRQTFAV